MTEQSTDITLESKPDIYTDTDEFKRRLSEQQQEILRELREIKRLANERETATTKRLHNIFAWIASQFKT